MKVYASNNYGLMKPTEIEIEPNDSVENLKEAIRTAQKLPGGVDQIRLIFKGKQLEDGRSLGDYGIEDGDTVTVVRRLGGY